MTSKPKTRMGRPPASSSAETRRRILDVARASFGELGYGVTTNRFIATKAGITTAALYHYFDSKRDIYLAVYSDVEDAAFRRLERALAAHDTFVSELEAVLDESHAVNLEDPSIARFLASARIDVTRHSELAGAFRGRRNPTLALYSLMVERGIATGELDPADRAKALAFLRAVFTGLVDALAGRPAQQREAMDGLLDLVRGTLVHKPMSHRRS
jgi:AcrR family transcriptional regulator